MLVPKVYKELYGNAILAWCSPIADEAFLLENVQLSDVEKEKLNVMTAHRRRHEWLTTRWLLQTILSKDVEIWYKENGDKMGQLQSQNLSYLVESGTRQEAGPVP